MISAAAAAALMMSPRDRIIQQQRLSLTFDFLLPFPPPLFLPHTQPSFSKKKAAEWDREWGSLLLLLWKGEMRERENEAFSDVCGACWQITCPIATATTAAAILFLHSFILFSFSSQCSLPPLFAEFSLCLCLWACVCVCAAFELNWNFNSPSLSLSLGERIFCLLSWCSLSLFFPTTDCHRRRRAQCFSILSPFGFYYSKRMRI